MSVEFPDDFDEFVPDDDVESELRRPPRLWEERLTRATSIMGVGISGDGDATSLASDAPPPGSGGGVEPAPVLPPPGDFIKPSTPTLIGSVQGIRVLWDGLNVDGELWPYDTSFIEVHMATSGTGFTPGTATLQGRLARPGGLAVSGLTAGTTYHFRLMGADPAGNVTDPSDAASGQTGLTTSSDYGTASIGTGAVSFDARSIGGVTNTVGSVAPTSPLLNDVWLDSSPGTAIVHRIWNGSTWVANAWGSASIAAGQVTALQIAAGAVTAGAIAAGAVTADKIEAGAVTTDKLTAGTVTGFVISGGTVTGGFVTGGTISAPYFTSAPFSQRRVELGAVSPTDAILFQKASSVEGWRIYHNTNADLTIFNSEAIGSLDVIAPITSKEVRIDSTVRALDAYRQTTNNGDVIFRCESDVTSTKQAKFEVRGNGDVVSRTNSYGGFSDERQKENITPARDYTDDLREVDVVTFNWQNSEQKLLGVTAQQLQTVFPSMVMEDEDGTLSVKYSVFVPMLITAVQSLADKVDELTARIEALEA